MPPKHAKASKRKASSSDDEGEPQTKKSKLSSAIPPLENAQPTNKVLPVHISFPPRIPGTLRLATWNVCGLAGFKYYLEAEDPDILVLTETKVNNEPVDPSIKEKFPYAYWSIAEKKTYSGIAILSKHKPLNITKTLPGHPNSSIVKGRIITLEFESCYLIGTYVVNAGMGLKTLEDKKEWNVHFETYIRDLDKKKPVIWTGDLNVAPTDMDLCNAKKNWNKTPGYTEAETSSFNNILNPPSDSEHPKLVDVWRHFHPTDRHYTYFSYRFNCREKGLGWRLDMFVLSERILERAKLCEIRSEIYGASDHCPVVMEFEGTL
ncbi:hypothetical protein L208DRAFT_243381 [Tricholoma matsutake]|nr:hypothetical protein L208DRAFT_243381 [Tricholoma matsutake 945]